MNMLATRLGIVSTSISCAFALSVALAGCSDGLRRADLDEQGPDTSIARGELVVYLIDHEGAMDTEYFLRLADGSEHKLVFDVDPPNAPGLKLRVWGEKTPGF